MSRRRFGVGLTAGALALSLTGGVAAAAEPASLPVMTPEIDPNPDLELIAKSRGWTIDEARAQQLAADAVGEIAVRLAKASPDAFVGSALSEEPGGAPTLYVKGPADGLVKELISGASVEILVADNQPYSFLELEARSSAVHRAVEAQGYRNVVTRTNITGGGVIPVAVGAQEGLSMQAADVLARVPAALRENVVLTIADPSGFRDTAAFGGMWMRDDGANECTSGFTVRDLSAYTTFGVTTAGHCGGINQIYHPGHGTHTTDNQAQHRGAYGDVEWHTTSAAEDATFYAETTTVRAVLYLEARAAISVGEQVCQYGRASDRDCDLDVRDVSIECTNDGVYNNRLVQMTGITSAKGDSGGPWFRDYRVFGSQKGWCNSRDAWSVADLYDEALGVQVVIYE